MIDVSAFVTAGGRSSRMGQDKAWLDLGGMAMIEHVVAALAPVASNVAIIANSSDYQRLGLPVFADSHIGIGPLEAIRTALANTTTTRVILAGCDLPFVTSDLFKLLLSIEGEHLATVPVGEDGKLEPLCSIYCAQALPVVTDLINSGERKASLLFDRVRTRFVRFEDLSHLAGSELFFKNINSPDDYARAREAFERNLWKTS